MNKFFHTGDLGDAISALPSVKALGGGDFLFGFQPDGQREPMFGERFKSIEPLLKAQPYIKGVAWSDYKNGVTHDFSKFRERYERHGNLALQHAKQVGVEITLEPWLTAPRKMCFAGTLIARTQRYHNPIFPWRRVVDYFKAHRDGVYFVGLPDEHKEFESRFGTIEHIPTSNLLELASIIANSNMLVCNQSCPFWIAAGLGTPLIQETFWGDMNSIVPRENARYTRSTQEVNELLETLK